MKFWISESEPAPDQHVAFRGTFELSSTRSVELRSLGASYYTLWVDGEYLNDGPSRYPASHPQYEPHRLELKAGKHVIAVHAMYVGSDTRMLTDIRPFLDIAVMAEDKALSVDWKCLRLEAYEAEVRRINPQLGWIDWCDTRALPADWEQPEFVDSEWAAPVEVDPELPESEAATIGEVAVIDHELTPMASGPLAERFGYAQDDVPARFFLRDLECNDVPQAGIWRRYDLGRIRLGRPWLDLSLPEGSIVEIAYSETLAHGRVQPYITLSAGDSCNLDHFVARGGRQVFFPSNPKGGRYMEVHILMPMEVYDAGEVLVTVHEEKYLERTYWPEVNGAFKTDNALLNQIWEAGVETLRACSEDAVTDNPTRERGQWTGDTLVVGLGIASVAFKDLRLFRRALYHCVQCAREDGMVAGHSPSNLVYIPPYACRWTCGCLDYHDATGDTALLRDLYDAAKKNIGAFERFLTDDGLVEDIEDGGDSGVTNIGWIFIDWGYVPNPGPSDMAMNLHFLDALRAMKAWCDRLDKTQDLAYYTALEERVKGIVKDWIQAQFAAGEDAWERIGYHRTAFSLQLNLLEEDQIPEALAFMKAHIMNCFPNNPDAPRNDDPGKSRTQLITPYFAHFALPVLIEHGEGAFVLDQYRQCWGWMLEDDRTTLVEVFDTRWTHCHHWSGSPTWQLSRYCLGLHPRFEHGDDTYALRFIPMGLHQAEGVLPLQSEGEVAIRWHEEDGAVHYVLNSSRPITVLLTCKDGSVERREVSGKTSWILQDTPWTSKEFYQVLDV